MAGLLLATPPASEPLTLTEAKAQLRITGSDDDTLIGALIASARSACETFLKMSLLPSVWSYRLDRRFPWEIRLPVGPVLDADSVTITYVDDAGDTQALATSEYRVSLGDTGVIRLAYGKVWPSTQPVSDAVAVQFSAGYANAEAIPPAIMQALRILLSDAWAVNRGAVRKEVVQGIGSIEYAVVQAADLPGAVANLLTPYVRFD